jgi:uncharacterized protein (DUF2384 family)
MSMASLNRSIEIELTLRGAHLGLPRPVRGARDSIRNAKGQPCAGFDLIEHPIDGFCVALNLPALSVILNTTDVRGPFMADLIEHETPTSEAVELQRVADLLGGSKILRRKLRNPLDAHEMLLQGLPGKALSHLIDNLVVLGRTGAFEKAVGMSLRTFQRRKDAPGKPLSQEQSGRTWKFAEILAKSGGARALVRGAAPHGGADRRRRRWRGGWLGGGAQAESLPSSVRLL